MAFPVTSLNKVLRIGKRGVYDAEQIHRIVAEAPILHVSFVVPKPEDSEYQFPTTLPMLGAIATHGNDSSTHLYLHGSSVARLFRNASVSSLPLCVAATCVDGYVLALAPFHNSCNYRSAVVYGLADTVTDPDEIVFALREITNAIIPHRNEESRSTPTRAELQATSVLKVRIESASAKVRTGGPSDDRADLADETLVKRTWTGVVPVYPFLGQPLASETNNVSVPPEYLVDWIEDANSRAEQYAVDATE